MKRWVDPTIERMLASQVLDKFNQMKFEDRLTWLKDPVNRERLEKAAALTRKKF
jgi:hypothetical protein